MLNKVGGRITYLKRNVDVRYNYSHSPGMVEGQGWLILTDKIEETAKRNIVISINRLTKKWSVQIEVYLPTSGFTVYENPEKMEMDYIITFYLPLIRSILNIPLSKRISKYIDIFYDSNVILQYIIKTNYIDKFPMRKENWAKYCINYQ